MNKMVELQVKLGEIMMGSFGDENSLFSIFTREFGQINVVDFQDEIKEMINNNQLTEDNLIKFANEKMDLLETIILTGYKEIKEENSDISGIEDFIEFFTLLLNGMSELSDEEILNIDPRANEVLEPKHVLLVLRTMLKKTPDFIKKLEEELK